MKSSKNSPAPARSRPPLPIGILAPPPRLQGLEPTVSNLAETPTQRPFPWRRSVGRHLPPTSPEAPHRGGGGYGRGSFGAPARPPPPPPQTLRRPPRPAKGLPAMPPSVGARGCALSRRSRASPAPVSCFRPPRAPLRGITLSAGPSQGFSLRSFFTKRVTRLRL